MRVMMLLVSLFLVAPLARAQDAAAEIRAVIAGQIDAFRADDLERAFSFASPGIRRMFGSPDRFGEMVRRGYPMVRSPGMVKFSGLNERGGQNVQSVLLTDQAGALFIIDYDMILTEGGWQIDGVRLRAGRDAGA